MSKFICDSEKREFAERQASEHHQKECNSNGTSHEKSQHLVSALQNLSATIFFVVVCITGASHALQKAVSASHMSISPELERHRTL